MPLVNVEISDCFITNLVTEGNTLRSAKCINGLPPEATLVGAQLAAFPTRLVLTFSVKDYESPTVKLAYEALNAPL